MPIAPDKLVPALFFAFIGWRVVGRIRRNIGRQPVKTARLLVRVGIYAVVTLFLILGIFLTGARIQVFYGLVGGLVLGGALGLFGLHLTRFETTPEGRFYTPNPYMGAAVSFLFVGRLLYRYLVLASSNGSAASDPQTVLTPLTMLIYGLLAGYYLAFFMGIFARSRTM